jgi:hypothetical protein
MLSHAPPFCGGKSMGGAGMVGGAGEEIFELKHFLVMRWNSNLGRRIFSQL